ncbi:hypothetical protein CTAYLR_000676 [Chrysophaeum taylorii]|uniref:PX domain-containing protein n=1 Tax=Chrysophaeum taylorii TaxID=2483200 RepID=A0AAD7XJ58_9STRA|nr:hypothetical protein CTAYLR_000676 [Chrysophaeum taylorii]
MEEEEEEEEVERERLETLDLEGEEEEEEEIRANPCSAVQHLIEEGGPLARMAAAAASARKKYFEQSEEEGDSPSRRRRDVSGIERVVSVEVRPKLESLTVTSKVRYEGCDAELTIGGTLTRTVSDFEWLRRRLVDEFPGCVVPPLLGKDPPALNRFVARVVEHPVLTSSGNLLELISFSDSELKETKLRSPSRPPPLLVRVGAVILDVVGDATPVDLTPHPKRREADVRELYAWARDQAAKMSKCERECALGVAALAQFETMDKSGPPASGPARALAALRELVGLAKALCEAIQGRERTRLQLVAAKNALELNKVSDTARRAMENAACSQLEAARDLEAGRPAEREGCDELPVENVDDDEGGRRRPPGWENIVETLKTRAATLGGLGLRVVSKLSTAAANASSGDREVRRARDLVASLERRFSEADSRLTADAPALKQAWDDLQLQAFESFAIGEQNRADVARAKADGAALKLAAKKATTTSSTTTTEII